MNDIPPIAWIIVIAILLLTIGLNYSLYQAYKRQSKKSGDRKSLLDKFNDGLRGPFQNEQKDLDELSQLVKNIQPSKTKPDQQNSDDGSNSPRSI